MENSDHREWWRMTSNPLPWSHTSNLQPGITKSAYKKKHQERLEISMSSSKICHWQNETLHETVIIWNCTSMSSFKPLPLQLESGFRPLPVPQSLPCSPFFTTKWSALDWGGKFKDDLQENMGTTRSKTRKREQRQEPIVLERPAAFCKRNLQEEFGGEGDEIWRWRKRKLSEMGRNFVEK